MDRCPETSVHDPERLSVRPGLKSAQIKGLSSDGIQTECFNVKIILQMTKQTRHVEIKRAALIKDPAELKMSVMVLPQNKTEHFPHVIPG